MVLIQGNEKIMENCKFYPNFKIQRLACHMQISTMSPRMHLTMAGVRTKVRVGLWLQNNSVLRTSVLQNKFLRTSMYSINIDIGT
jgi:hypothetical protein